MYERKFKVTATLQDAYKLYRKQFGEVNKATFLAIAYDIMLTVSDMIIRESLEYRIPNKMGFLRVRKTKQRLIIKDGRIDCKRNKVDWNKSWEAWYKMYPNKSRKEIMNIPNKGLIYHKNYHTDGHIMRWYWVKKFSNVINSSVYSFDPVKGGKVGKYYTGRLGLAMWIKSDEKTNDYYF